MGPDPQPAEIVRPGTQRRAVDRLELTVRGNSAGAVPVRVESAGGLSDPVPLEVSPPSFPGPRLARVTPSQVFAGTTSQVVVVVENVDAAQVSAVQVLRREAGAEAELLATTLSPTATRLVRLRLKNFVGLVRSESMVL